MKQQLKAVLDNDRGVSPVIGVILMVAITVILAAVIGTFVLNLGGDLQQTPQAQISLDANDGDDRLDINHNGGDAIPVGDMRIEGTAGGSDISQSFQSAANGYSGSELSVGDTAYLANGTGSYDITVVHAPSDSVLFEGSVTVE